MKAVGKYLTNFQRNSLHQQLTENLSDVYRQRLQIMLLSDAGKTQSEICQKLGCSPATASHWIHIARLGMADQWQDCSLGRPRTISSSYTELLHELLQNSPRDHGYSFSRWTVQWLSNHLEKELGVSISERHLKRVMKSLGLSTIKKIGSAGNVISKKDSISKNSNSRITISDINSNDLTHGSSFLDLDFIPLEIDIKKIHGSQSVFKSYYLPTATRSCVRLFNFTK